MRTFLFVLLSFILWACSSSVKDSSSLQNDDNQLIPQNGAWRFALDLNTAELPFTLQIFDLETDQPHAILTNQDEKILIDNVRLVHDSIYFKLPVFPSILACKIESPSLLSGAWINLSKENYSIPLVAEYDKDFRFSPTSSNTRIGRSYHVRFSPENEDEWDAVLKTKNVEGKIHGTFLTETGDYRYLDGNIINDKLLLSTFDGSHAFYFSADISGDSLINGSFLSGIHYSTNWKAVIDTTFELRKPEQLTFLTEGAQYLDFQLPNENGDTVSWSDLNLDGKVVIVDIMGSWCPNCIDANKALKELTSPYSSDEIEILTVAFELTKEHSLAKKRVFDMQEELGMTKQFLFGGYADKTKSKEVFPMLNHIMSFPTLVFIDKNRSIRQIYTGFYGPGTGEYYTNFMQNTSVLLEEMVNDSEAYSAVVSTTNL